MGVTIAFTVEVQGMEVIPTGTVLLIPVDVRGFRSKTKLLVVPVVLQVVKVVVVVVDVIADPENFIPNPKAISSSDPVKVAGVPNENALAAVELEAFDTEMNPMVLELVVATTVDAGTKPQRSRRGRSLTEPQK